MAECFAYDERAQRKPFNRERMRCAAVRAIGCERAGY
jgi:hypothetical protein